jgi:hypothetical protein
MLPSASLASLTTLSPYRLLTRVLPAINVVVDIDILVIVV